MPLIKVQTSVSQPPKSEVESLLKDLSASLAHALGKPESYVMTAFEADVAMTFAGTTEAVCYMEIKSIGLPANKTKTISQDFCQKINQLLDIPVNRIYIEFADAERNMWGWNGTTF
ncbi:MAG: phenylpyruvate tautomerase MIF-related protein [Microcoleaceae cyanobacterium]